MVPLWGQWWSTRPCPIVAGAMVLTARWLVIVACRSDRHPIFNPLFWVALIGSTFVLFCVGRTRR